jgi:hypothetical protein
VNTLPWEYRFIFPAVIPRLSVESKLNYMFSVVRPGEIFTTR